MTTAQGKGFRQNYRDLSFRGKLVFWVGVVLVFYALLGFLVLPVTARMVLEMKLPKILHRTATIQDISFNPFRLTLVVKGLNIGQMGGKGSFVSFDRLFVNLEAYSLVKKALVVSELQLDGPRIEFTRNTDGSYSFADLLTGGKKPAGGKTTPFYFSLNNISITAGRIIFHDQLKGGEHEITALKLAVPDISNLPYQVDTFVQPAFSANVDGTPFALKGESKPFAESRETVVTLKIDGLDLPRFTGYIPNPTGLRLKSALLDVDARLHYRTRPDNSPRLSVEGRVALRDLAITDSKGQAYLQLPQLAVTMGDSDLLAGEVRLTEVDFDQPSLRIERLMDGSLLPVALVTEKNRQEAQPAEGAGAAAEPKPEKEEKASRSLDLAVGKLVLKKGHIDFLDAAVPQVPERKGPVRLQLDNLELLAENLSTAKDRQGALSISFDLNQAGNFQARGSLGLEPFQTALHLNLTSLSLQPFQPYISEQASIVMASGALSAAGDLSLAPRAQGGYATSFKGRSELNGLATVDTVKGEDLLKWRKLGIGGISYTSDPGSLSIDGITLEKPYVKVSISSKGTVNLATISREQAPAGGEKSAAKAVGNRGKQAGKAPPEQEKKSPFTTKIGSVKVRDGQIDFIDHRVNPAYGANLGAITGGIGALSSAAGTSAPVTLSATLDGQAPLKISGRINPLSKKLFVDLKVDFSDINLTPMSPYTAKYLGYKTDKGKLNLDLKYDIEGHQLVSDNKAFLDQFTLGEAVASKDAVKLPITLAIALLKDRQGGIHLDVPVQGNLNDPNFRVGGVIIQVLVNLVAKAATSPFALLSALIPEGQDLQYISFKAGSADFDRVADGKLATLAKVLYERPGLRMDIVGMVDPTTDGAALAQARLVDSVRLQKLLAAGGKAEAPAGKEKAKEALSREEYLRYLPAAYKAARKASPDRKPPKGPVTPESMEAYILGGIKIGTDDLRLLALQRANRVLSGLVASGKVEAGRLFVVAPVLGGTGKGGGASQVKLVIK